MVLRTIPKSLPLAVACMAAMAQGCLPSGIPVDNGVEIPPAVQHVLDDPGAFTFKGDENLAAVMPGEFREPLANIVGCWAHFVPAGSGAGPAIVYAISFQPNSVYESWVFQGGLLGLFSISAYETGTYEIVNDSVLDVHPVTVETCDNVFGCESFEDGTHWGSWVTVQGDELLFVLGSVDLETLEGIDYDVAENRYLLMRRLECP